MCWLWALSLKWQDPESGTKAFVQKPDPDSISMPPKASTAVKARKDLEEYEERMKRAVDEFYATRGQTPQPSQADIADKHGVKRPTLSARIQGRPSKLVSASQRQKIYPDEENLIVDYLVETARRGFPDTRKRCL